MEPGSEEDWGEEASTSAGGSGVSLTVCSVLPEWSSKSSETCRPCTVEGALAQRIQG